MTSLPQRQHINALITQAVNDGARQAKACEVIGGAVRTLQRWQQNLARADGRPQRQQQPHAHEGFHRALLLRVRPGEGRPLVNTPIASSRPEAPAMATW